MIVVGKVNMTMKIQVSKGTQAQKATKAPSRRQMAIGIVFGAISTSIDKAALAYGGRAQLQAMDAGVNPRYADLLAKLSDSPPELEVIPCLIARYHSTYARC